MCFSYINSHEYSVSLTGFVSDFVSSYLDATPTIIITLPQDIRAPGHWSADQMRNAKYCHPAMML